MIKTSTVLVLGAGASIPFGFPSGSQLFESIYNDKFNYSYKWGQVNIPDRTWIDNFRKTLFQSELCTIDEFLEHRTEYINIGKFAIAASLIPCEKDDLVFKGDTSNNWFKYLYNKMRSDSGPDEFFNNKISFISFNYDRSLEYFLFMSLKNTFQLGDAKSGEILRKFNFLHLHGQLGFLPFLCSPNQAQFIIPYNYTALDPLDLYNASKCIKVIHENTEIPQFEEAFELMNNASRIYFLGFGYHPINLKRLRISDIKQSGKLIAGTALGIDPFDIERIGVSTNVAFKGNHLFNGSILEFFKKYRLD